MIVTDRSDNMNGLRVTIISTSIGGLVVKLAVAIRDIISYDSASPGFDSRPMQFYSCDIIRKLNRLVLIFCMPRGLCKVMEVMRDMLF
jgi:hypothetical protein